MPSRHSSSSSSTIEGPKKFEIPRLGQSPIFIEDYPVLLDGIIAPPDYEKVVTKLNRIRAKVESKKRYSETLMTTLLLTGTVFLIPLFPLTVLFAQKEKEISKRIDKFLDTMNGEFKERGVEFVFVCPSPSSMVKKVFIVTWAEHNSGRYRLPGSTGSSAM